MAFSLASIVLVTLSAVLLWVASIALTVLALQFYRIRQVAPQIPWVGIEGRKWFAKLQAVFLALGKDKEFLREGYEKHTKHGSAFVMPGLHWNEVILPPDNVKWLASLPEDVCDAVGVQNDLMGFEWLSHGPDLDWVREFDHIRREMKENMHEVVPELLDEVREACGDVLGEGDDVEGVKILKALKIVSFRAANRLIVGTPLCRDEEYYARCQRWMLLMALSGLLARSFVPGRLKQYLMPILAIPYRRAFRGASNMYLERVAQRMEWLRSRKDGMDDAKPNDLVQWTIERAKRRHKGQEISTRDICDKLVMLNIFAAHTINTTLGAVLIDILAQPPEGQLLPKLREEAKSALEWIQSDPRALSRMRVMDSVMRESLRFNPPNDHGMMRQIVCEGGVTTPDGLHLPQGTHVGAHITFMQRQEDAESDWAEFRPLRYCDGPHNEADLQITAARVSERFLPFALGRHACPGRALAVNVLKLILGYLIAHYELEVLAERPRFVSVGGVNLPPEDLSIKIRREVQGTSTR